MPSRADHISCPRASSRLVQGLKASSLRRRFESEGHGDSFRFALMSSRLGVGGNSSCREGCSRLGPTEARELAPSELCLRGAPRARASESEADPRILRPSRRGFGGTPATRRGRRSARGCTSAAPFLIDTI